jgi:hypothetical protein
MAETVHDFIATDGARKVSRLHVEMPDSCGVAPADLTRRRDPRFF